MVKQVKAENGKTYEFPDDATDQEINSLLPPPPSTAEKVAGSAPIQFILGAGDATRNLLSAGMYHPQSTNFGLTQGPNSGSGNAYGAGKIAGDIGGFIGGGEILDAARFAGSGAPLVGGMLDKLGGQGIYGIARRGIGSSIGGAISNPDDRSGGAAEGALLSGGLDIAPSIFKGTGKLLAKAIGSMSPKNQSEFIMNNLVENSGLTQDQYKGGKALEENGKLLASNINNAFKKSTGEASNDYRSIFGNFGGGDRKILVRVDPIQGTSEIGAYEKSMPGEKPYGDNSVLNSLHKTYLENPTLDNAHKLQSELGHEVGYLQRRIKIGEADQLEKNNLPIYAEARDAAKNDIMNGLAKVDSKLAQDYSGVTDFYRQNVVPYYSDKTLRQIANGEIKNPTSSQITSIFKNPESSIEKVTNDIGDQGRHQIILNHLGKIHPRDVDENKLLKKYEDLDNQGLSSYRTNELMDNFDSLNKKIGRSNVGQRLTAGLAGGLIGHAIGVPGVETSLETIGAIAGPKLMKMIPGYSLNSTEKSALSKLLSKSYQPLGRAAIAGELQGN